MGQSPAPVLPLPDSLGFLQSDVQGRAGQHHLLLFPHSSENQLQEFKKASWRGQDKKNGGLLVDLGREIFFWYCVRAQGPQPQS